ncbi:MAG: hypothetical protein WCK42_01255 [Myxococcaceae bacterium]
MHRLTLLAFLFALATYSDSEYPSGLVWLKNPPITCGGVLIQSDVVLAEASCVGAYTEIVWPYKSGIKKTEYTTYPDAKIAILFLDRKLPNPTPLSSQNENETVWISNDEISQRDWVESADNDYFGLHFGLDSYLLGSPVFTDPLAGLYSALGMMIGKSKVLKFSPYFQDIQAKLKLACDLKEREPEQPFIAIPATVSESHIKIPAQVVSEESAPVLVSTPVEAPTEAVPAAKIEPGLPPTSLGCSCSQVRR